MQALGVDVVRISPKPTIRLDILELYKTVLTDAGQTCVAGARLVSLMPDEGLQQLVRQTGVGAVNPRGLKRLIPA